jgi:hypothetical protein
MSKKFLYRRLGSAVIVILLFFAGSVPRSAAQGRPQLKRPEDIPQEKPPEPKKKKVKGPRAVGILQLTSNGKGTLIPVAILIDGKFYDASAYKADPVPMALESGTVYEVEQAGDSQGLFTVSGALHSKNPGSPNPWVGAGSFLPNGTEAAKATRKAEDVPIGLDASDSDAPPRLSRGNASKPAATPNPAPAAGSSAPASSTPASGTPSGNGSSEKPASASAPPVSSQPASGSSGDTSSTGQDAPKPAAPAPSDTPADQSGKQPAPTPGQPSPGQSSSGQTSQGQQTQTPQSQTSQTQTPQTQAQETQSQAPQGQTENYYRPTLRRGKPTQSAPEEEEPAPKAGPPQSPAAAAVTSTQPAKLVPAISDAGGPDPRSYNFFWKPGEEDERRNQMLALAQDEVRAYANALIKNRIPANAPTAKAAGTGHKPPAKPPQPVLENVQFHAYDVWGNNQVVMILTADAHFPPAPGATATPEQYSIALVTHTDIYGNLRKLYSGVTDKFHLDVTPRLELVDVVDADGDGRGELLFRETTDAGGGYVIYRATADKLWKMFDSLSE